MIRGAKINLQKALVFMMGETYGNFFTASNYGGSVCSPSSFVSKVNGIWKNNTLPETNIAHENGWLEY